MDRYSVKISPQAYKELDAIYRYISTTLFAPNAAINLVDKIESAILSLDEMPNRGAVRKVGRYADMGYRQLFVDSYTVVYRVDEAKRQVIIITVKYTPSAF